MKKRILSILLCALLVCGLLPTSALAAPSDAPLSNASQNQNIDAGSISKNVSDTGFTRECLALQIHAEAAAAF